MLTSSVTLQSRKLLSTGLALATAALFAACGGGGSHSDSSTPTPPAPPAGVSYDVVTLIDDATARIRVTPNGINETDMVAGTIFPTGDRPSRAFLYNGTATVDLGDFGGASSQAFNITRCGYVAGSALRPDGIAQAFLYDGTLRDIGTPGIFSEAAAVSDCRKVVGVALFGGARHAFLYDGEMHDLGTLPGRTRSSAVDINTAGVVAGNSDTADGSAPEHAFIYDSAGTAGLQDLGTLGGLSSNAVAINSAGQVIGFSFTSADQMRAFRYSGGTMQNLGTLEGDDSSAAFDVNDAGFVVGMSGTFVGMQRAFMHDGVKMHNIGTLGGKFAEALAINASGVVVGSSSQPDELVAHAISWTLAGGIVDLNKRLNSPPAGLVLIQAMAISDQGSIVAKSNTGLVLLKVHK
jgi:probable HAF family extracellular repeat protein